MTNTLLDFLRTRQQRHETWQKIPWHDPDFSRRMLAEHLSQAHDAASRRLPTIDAHVDWIHRKVLETSPANILDLGCGPGFYMDRLSKLGHTCTGIVFSPASVAYAQEHHAGSYRLGDLLTEDYGSGYDLAMLIYGELNAFSPDDAQTILEKAYAALKPGGKLLLEVSNPHKLEEYSKQAPSWFTSEGGLFSEKPHLCLQEHSFDLGCWTTNFYVLEESGSIQTYTTMHQVYTQDELRQMLAKFSHVLIYPSLTGSDEEVDFFALVAVK